MSNGHEAMEYAMREQRMLQESIALCAAIPGFDTSTENWVWPFDIDFTISRDVIHVVIPYSKEAFKLYRKRLGREWKVRTYSTTTHSSDHITKCISYTSTEEKSNSYILLALDTHEPGSTCVVVPDGTEVVTKYKVVCS